MSQRDLQTKETWIAKSRDEKVTKLANFLLRAGAKAGDVALMSDQDWKLAEAGAGVREASAISRELVARRVEDSLRPVAKFQGDPFAGF